MLTSCPRAPLYRQREIHQSALWRILVDHQEVFLRQYERRYLDSHGPLPREAEKVLDKLLCCGDPRYGLSLLHCPDCQVHMAVPFSCKTRVCPSCVNRRAEDVSQSLVELPSVAYRHVVVTVPIKMGLRKRFRSDRRLLRAVARLIQRVLCRWMPQQLGCHRNRRGERDRALPGIILAQQTFGKGLKSHPHWHLLVSDGCFFPDGTFWPQGYWDVEGLHDVLRTAILKSLVARCCLTPESAAELGSWPRERSGFSAFVGPELQLPEQEEDVGRVLRYILRTALPLKRLRYHEATARVELLTARGGVEKSWDHAVDFLADFCQHIPKARQHQVSYAGHFANALSKLKPKPRTESDEGVPAGPSGGKSSRWAALVLRTWAVDPELCPRCGNTMKRSRPLRDQTELERLLNNLNIGKYPCGPARHRPRFG